LIEIDKLLEDLRLNKKIIKMFRIIDIIEWFILNWRVVKKLMIKKFEMFIIELIAV